jgi:hypothetical protein
VPVRADVRPDWEDVVAARESVAAGGVSLSLATTGAGPAGSRSCCWRRRSCCRLQQPSLPVSAAHTAGPSADVLGGTGLRRAHEDAERAQQREVLALHETRESGRHEQLGECFVAVQTVAADEQVGAAHGLAALGAAGKLVPGSLGEGGSGCAR